MCLAPVKTNAEKVRPSAVKRSYRRSYTEQELEVGSWNSNGMTFNRYEYLKAKGLDVLGLQELHTGQWGNWEGRDFFASESPPNGDSFSGVAIMLSNKAQKRVLSSGKVGSRIVWVRLSGKFILQTEKIKNRNWKCYLHHGQIRRVHPSTSPD